MDMVSPDRTIDGGLSKSLSAIWHRKFSFLFTTAIIFSASAIAILAMQPMYEGTTLLVSGQVSLERSADGIRSRPENETLAQIAHSDEVIRAAIAKTGTASAMDSKEPGTRSIFARGRAIIFGAGPELKSTPSATDAAIPIMKGRLRVRTELTSNIISISFRDRDPAFATNFANAVAQAFVDRQIALSSRPGAADFFLQQKQRFDEEFKHAADELERLSTDKGLYSIDQQRELLLKRLSESAAAIAANRAAIADKTGQRQVLGEQLKQLSPVARNPFVSGLVDSLIGIRTNSSSASNKSTVAEWTKDPPLLLVRVYQDSMTSLFKINADIAGAKALEDQYQQEQTKLKAELNTLAQYSERIEALRRTKALAAFNSEAYAKRMVEEQIAAELHAARFSSVKVMQMASEPTQPAFPNYILFFAAAALFSITCGVAIVILRHVRR